MPKLNVPAILAVLTIVMAHASSPVQPFAAFIAAIEAAQPAAYVGKPGYAVQGAAAFAEMKAHVLELYRGVSVRTSFVGSEGQVVDCIPIDQQPGLRPPGRQRGEVSRDAPPNAVSPPELRGDGHLSGRRRSEDLSLKPGQRDQTDDATFCPTGTIPMERVTLDRMAAYPNLAAFLAK